MTGIWVAADVITAARANEKTIFQGTGAAISGLATTYAGQLAFCTSTGSGFSINMLYLRNATNTAWINPIVSTSTLILSASSTIGDYTTPTSATASSVGDSTTPISIGRDTAGATANSDTQTLTVSSSNTNRALICTVHYSGSSTITVTGVTWGAQNMTLLTTNNSGSPYYLNISVWSLANPTSGAGTATATFSSAPAQRCITLTSLYGVNQSTPINTANYVGGGGNAVATFTNNVTPTNTGSWLFQAFSTQYSSTGNNRTTNTGPTLAGGDTSNYTQYFSSPTINSSNDMSYTQGTINLHQSGISFEIISASSRAFASAYIFDNDTTTRWTSTSEINPNIYLDMGSNNLSAITLYADTTNTTSTQIKIQGSTDAVTWRDLRTINVSSLTNLAYNYIRFNVGLYRYIRVYGTDTGAKVLSIWEAKVQKCTDAVLLLAHGHLPISNSDTSISLSVE